MNYYAKLNGNKICKSIYGTKKEMESEYCVKLEFQDLEVLGKKYVGGKWEEVIPEPEEPTEEEMLQAEMLLNQVVMLENQKNQDAVLAEILIGQLGV